jgi:hypothetical protein
MSPGKNPTSTVVFQTHIFHDAYFTKTRAIASTNHPLISNLTPIFSVSPVGNDETVSTSEGDDSFAWMDESLSSYTCMAVTFVQCCEYSLSESVLEVNVTSTH